MILRGRPPLVWRSRLVVWLQDEARGLQGRDGLQVRHIANFGTNTGTSCNNNTDTQLDQKKTSVVNPKWFIPDPDPVKISNPDTTPIILIMFENYKNMPYKVINKEKEA